MKYDTSSTPTGIEYNNTDLKPLNFKQLEKVVDLGAGSYSNITKIYTKIFLDLKLKVYENNWNIYNI